MSATIILLADLAGLPGRVPVLINLKQDEWNVNFMWVFDAL